ncbi:MAG: antibiotic ABC transporter ATP-binding protein [Bacteroidetes bacterium 4572_117]|nr:MAG: antibiotic ABC transporter ATP-binding protein [Bacteroidetes bacterium 4572_117]
MKEFLKILFSYIKPYKVYALLNVVLNFFSAVFSLFSLTLLIPFLSILFDNKKLIIDEPEFALKSEAVLNYFYYYISQIIIEDGKITALLYVSIFVLITIILKNLFIYFANFFMVPLRNGIVKDIRNKIYHKVLHLHIGFFSEEKKGDIIARMTSDAQEFEMSAIASIEMIFRDPLLIMIFLISLIFISPILTLLIFILLPFSGFVIARIGKSLKKTSSQARSQMGSLLANIEETIGGLRIIKAFNAEKKIGQKFTSQNQSYTKVVIRISRREYIASPLSEFLGVLILMVVMYFGVSMVLGEQSDMSPEVFIGYIAIFSQIINPAKSITSAYYRIQKGLAAMERVDEILNTEINIKETENAQSVSEFKNNIVFENVSFKYNKNDVLTNIDIEIKKGNTLALVGQSGSGKSTLIDLLPRFYDITVGNIKIDGQPIKTLRIKDLRLLMGNVNQESILFNDTIFNNIAFSVESATKEEVITAAKVANAHEFIKETAEGYETNIGDRGSKLSGGQRQRLSIARAVLKNPPILILDEATSALDTESERLVQEALANLMKNRTSIVIAHRLSTIKHADEICVLHEGKIVERGNHEELILKNGAYKKLHDLQIN